MITVTQLHVYPVKSCRGVSIATMELDDRGPIEDRRWMVVDADGRFLTQREHPRLALVSVELTDEGVRLSAPGHSSTMVSRPLPTGTDFVTHVWGDEVAVRPAGVTSERWISAFLDRPARLVHLPDESVRAMRAEYAGAITAPRRVTLCDGAPLLLIGSASLDDLNARLPAPLPMNRFRPNVVVSGARPFAEDGWTSIRIGDVTFEVAKPCARCVTTTVDQATGETGVEPLRTLATYRRRGAGVLFGQNIAHHAPGVLRLGDVLRISD
ncbi:MAG: putative protein YcbX [Gemmatimonadaceae bacterium]|nr:putative protein YcbX [Gemmatimonadaceae bacterium]MCC6581028.1 MOSC domain-containing protein [Phycisphaeraceae bacterium]